MDNRRMASRRERSRIDTSFLRRCIRALEVAFEAVESYSESDTLYDLYRAACVKEFELVLEQSGALLRKRLAAFFASNQRADELVFKDLFRYAARHRLVEVEEAERWLSYRDSRNDTAHKYGEHFAEAILELLPVFIADAKALADIVEAPNDG